MAKIELIKTIVVTENILCIYRNFTMLDRKRKNFAVARVAFQFIVYFVAHSELFIHFINLSNEPPQKKILVIVTNTTAMLTTINSLITIFIAIIHSHTFRISLLNINRVHKYCSGGVNYQRRVQNLKKRVVFFMALITIFYTASFAINAWQWAMLYQDRSTYATVSGIFQSIITIWKDVRFQLEFLIFHCFIRMIIIPLQHLHENLLLFMKTIGESKELEKLTSLRLRRELENWAAAYCRLAVCSDGLKKCFGLQITFSLIILGLYFISMSYDWVATLTTKSPRSESLAIIMMINNTSAIMLLLYSGQWAKNEGDRVIRLMAKVYSSLLTIPGSSTLELRRSAKALYRQMVVQPIKIQLLTNTNVEMSLLLAILSTVVSYTIVWLQFSHIV